MAETLKSLPETQTEQQKDRLKKLARWVPRIYFGTDIKRELAGEEYLQLQSALCRKLTTVLNETLTNGGEVVVMDFPFAIGHDTNRVHVVTREAYLRQVNHVLTEVKAFEEGYFSIRVTKVEHPNVVGALSLQILKNAVLTYTIRWDEEEAKFRRFVILTKQDKIWKLLLDFDLQNRRPYWRISPQVFA